MRSLASSGLVGDNMRIGWVQRKEYLPADDLTNERFEGFNPGLRVAADLKGIRFANVGHAPGWDCRAAGDAAARAGGGRARQPASPDSTAVVILADCGFA